MLAVSLHPGGLDRPPASGDDLEPGPVGRQTAA